MARKSQHTFSKRQRERKKAEKAAQKRARRAARPDDVQSPADSTEPESESPDEGGVERATGVVNPS